MKYKKKNGLIEARSVCALCKFVLFFKFCLLILNNLSAKLDDIEIVMFGMLVRSWRKGSKISSSNILIDNFWFKGKLSVSHLFAVNAMCLNWSRRLNMTLYLY